MRDHDHCLGLKWNAALLVASLDPGELVSREQIIEELRRPRPPGQREDEAGIHHAFDHYVRNAAVRGAMRVVTYQEAADLTGKTVRAIRQARYRGAILGTTEYRDGWERTGVYLRSLADWCRWRPQQLAEAARQLDAMRDADR